jgi:uncharacterized protein (TIGR02594 family)
MRVKQYIVRRGDTLNAIAKFYGIALQELLDENPLINNPNLILVGETILVPDIETGSSIHNSLADKNIDIDLPPWMKIAMREEGVTEVSGIGNNPRILEYHETTSLRTADAKNDSTHWCSSFVNWCMEQAGEEGTDSAWAIDWNDWQEELISPRVGCIVVLSRKNKGTNGGHVGFCLSERDTDIEVLGGNQGDKVSRSFYPKNGRKGLYQYRLLSYRWTT